MPTLNWLTRDDDIRATSRVAYRLPEEVVEYSCGDRNTANMLIQGDNLDALKALLPFYAGREQFFTITLPSGRELDPPPGRCWLYTKDRFLEMCAEDRIWFGKNGNNAPRLKSFLSEVQSGLVPSTHWSHKEVGTTGTAKSEVVSLFEGETPFSTPKPEALIERVVHIATNPGDLVLDSFLGSGTTAAVAHKMGRGWIGVEMGEHAVTHCAPRLQKVVDGDQGGISERVGWRGGGGFRFYRLGPPAFDANGRICANIKKRSRSMLHRRRNDPDSPRQEHRRSQGLRTQRGHGTALHAVGDGRVWARVAGRRRPEVLFRESDAS